LASLALDGASDVAGSSRAPTALRYVDLVLLAAGLPVFIAAGLPMAGYAVIAAVWLAQHAIEFAADRAAARALDRGERRAAMGWIGATTLARVWLVMLAILLVGLLSDREAGLAAAVFALILFTVHLGGRLLARALGSDRGGGF
jgi:hypothetical protein